MIEGSSKILMCKKRLEYSICFGSISLATVDSLLNGLKELFHCLYKETHKVFHLRKFQAQSLILSPKPEKNYSEQLRKTYSKSKKKYNGCFKEYIKLSCSFYFLNDIEYDRAGLVPSNKSFWFAWKSTLGRKYSIKHSCLVNPAKIRKKSISFLSAPEL